eukprot:gene4946-4309_t
MPPVLRRRHDWRVCRQGDVVTWVASDDPDAGAILQLTRDPEEPPLQAVLRRRRMSADLAVALWGTGIEGSLCEKEVVVVDAGPGSLRAASSNDFSGALQASPEIGMYGAPLIPGVGGRALGRLRRPDGRLLWDNFFDSATADWVPATPASPNMLCGVLEWVQLEVLRKPPIHPLAADCPKFYPQSRSPYKWPRIVAVEWSKRFLGRFPEENAGEGEVV